MNPLARIIDHIVYCVPNLDEGVDHFESLFGIRPVIGGSHLNHGTKNALLNLGNGCYLEILAKDERNSNISGDRWMGIDLLNGPKITRWSLKSTDLSSDSQVLKQSNAALGSIIEGNRKTTSGNLLSWKMIQPLSSPEIDVLPFMTDWSSSDIHPTDALQEGCRLENIYLYHPNPKEIQAIISKLDIDIEVVHSREEKIEIEVHSPNGLTFIN